MPFSDKPYSTDMSLVLQGPQDTCGPVKISPKHQPFSRNRILGKSGGGFLEGIP